MCLCDCLSYYTTKLAFLSSPYCIIQISSVHDCILEDLKVIVFAFSTPTYSPCLFSCRHWPWARTCLYICPSSPTPFPSFHHPLPTISSIYKSLWLRFICIIIIIIINIITVISPLISSVQSCHPLPIPSRTIWIKLNEFKYELKQWRRVLFSLFFYATFYPSFSQHVSSNSFFSSTRVSFTHHSVLEIMHLCPIDWLTDWFVDLLTSWSIDWQNDWLRMSERVYPHWPYTHTQRTQWWAPALLSRILCIADIIVTVTFTFTAQRIRYFLFVVKVFPL